MNIQIARYGEGLPLVFFHGWAFDSTIWLPIVPILKQFYQVILVDLPGFGATPMMNWFEFKDQLLTALPEKFALAGWSLGGLYAMRLAIEVPERIYSLLNIASSPRFIAEASWPGVPKDVFLNFYNNLSLDPGATIKEFVALQSNKTKIEVELGHLPSESGLKSGLDMLDTWDLREQLIHNKIPTCFMFGRLDPITSVKTMNAMRDRYSEFQYILFNKAAHMPFLSHQDEFIRELRGFIQ